ncbi:MAG TPA: transposase, partial [Mycobacterium sp.]|nr:transposase [Mycobacterium sp.]
PSEWAWRLWTRSGLLQRHWDELEDATAVLDAFHVVKLGLTAMEETRRRVQQEQLGHRGRKNDPLYKIRNILRAGVERLTNRQIERLETGLQAGDPDYAVTVAWRCYQQIRSAYHASSLTEGHAIAVKIIDTFHTCPISEIARLGRTLRAWRTQFLAYFTTSRANNGGTEAICECRTGWSGTGWSGWSWSCRSVRDSRSN